MSNYMAQVMVKDAYLISSTRFVIVIMPLRFVHFQAHLQMKQLSEHYDALYRTGIIRGA